MLIFGEGDSTLVADQQNCAFGVFTQSRAAANGGIASGFQSLRFSAAVAELRPLHAMRTLATFIVLTIGFTSQAAPATNAVLVDSQYPAAEAVYRSFFPEPYWRESRTNLVYCLSFGSSDSALVSDFMARFQAPSPRVITGTNGFVVGPGSRVERGTGREVVILALRSLSIRGEHAEARVLYCAPSTVITETLLLTRKDGQWSVTKRKQESIACF